MYERPQFFYDDFLQDGPDGPAVPIWVNELVCNFSFLLTRRASPPIFPAVEYMNQTTLSFLKQDTALLPRGAHSAVPDALCIVGVCHTIGEKNALHKGVLGL